MKHNAQKLFFVVLTTLFSPLIADDRHDDHRNVFGISFFHPRPIGSNKARESAGFWQI